MNRKDVIKVLKMENDLITFDPHTGEEIDVRYLNDLNKKCYIAHEEAIDFLRQSIPIEWIKKWLWDNGDYFRKYEREIVEAIIVTMLKDWEKEKEEEHGKEEN